MSIFRIVEMPVFCPSSSKICRNIFNDTRPNHRPCHLDATPGLHTLKRNHVSVSSEGPWFHHPKRGGREQPRLGGAGVLPMQRRMEFEGTAKVGGICK